MKIFVRTGKASGVTRTALHPFTIYGEAFAVTRLVVSSKFTATHIATGHRIGQAEHAKASNVPARAKAFAHRIGRKKFKQAVATAIAFLK